MALTAWGKKRCSVLSTGPSDFLCRPQHPSQVLPVPRRAAAGQDGLNGGAVEARQQGAGEASLLMGLPHLIGGVDRPDVNLKLMFEADLSLSLVSPTIVVSSANLLMVFGGGGGQTLRCSVAIG